jgi:ParB family chromosome partitioning protein
MVGVKITWDPKWGWNLLRDYTDAGTARPEFSQIALICAGYEKTIQKDSWRSAEKRHFQYLEQLIS